MINVCTVSDSNYLFQGLTLYESLINTTSNIKVHYLCIDEITYKKIKSYESESLIAYNILDLLDSDSILLNIRQRNYKYFCWSLASYFSNYLIHKLNSDITYIDSDIYFHTDFNIILNAIGNNEVGIFRHRQFNLNSPREEGFYNVGVVHFKNTEMGIGVLDWWSDAVLYMKYPELATCGDQKYLDAFPEICQNDGIFIDGEIGHGAPWHWQLYDFSSYEDDGCIIWNTKKQKLIFTHFSQFKYDLNADEYIPSSMHHIYTPLQDYNRITQLKGIYDAYFFALKNTIKKYSI